MQILICDDDMNSAERCKERLVQISKKYNIDVDIEIVEFGKNFVSIKSRKFFPDSTISISTSVLCFFEI